MAGHPTKIGKYEVAGVIGRGGMGVVYKAVDPQIGRFVAIKMITAGFSGDQDLLKRFYREGDNVRLQPSNTTMQPIMVPAQSVRVQGRVIGVLRKY